MEKISRIKAIKNDKKRYYTGNPCAKGHDSERLTSNGKCVVCNRERIRTKVAEAKVQLPND